MLEGEGRTASSRSRGKGNKRARACVRPVSARRGSRVPRLPGQVRRHSTVLPPRVERPETTARQGGERKKAKKARQDATAAGMSFFCVKERAKRECKENRRSGMSFLVDGEEGEQGKTEGLLQGEKQGERGKRTGSVCGLYKEPNFSAFRFAARSEERTRHNGKAALGEAATGPLRCIGSQKNAFSTRERAEQEQEKGDRTREVGVFL